jgi:hypothetical protein
MNSLPKYGVSSTLEDPDRGPSTLLKGDVVHKVSKLKQARTGEIVVWASFQLVHTLMQDDLVDKLRLKMFPVVTRGRRASRRQTSAKKPMRLVDTQTVEGDVTFLTYERVRDA